jgi:hypothetical protein
MAQGIDVQVGRDRDGRDQRRQSGSDVAVGVGAVGLAAGSRRRESRRTVATSIQRDGGPIIKR